MAPSRRRTDPPLEKRLFSHAFEFDFFQAVRLLARLFPGRKPLGATAHPSDEIVRFASWHSLAFPASSVDTIDEPPLPGAQPRMTVTFLGLTGTQGVLPLYFTERLLAANAAKQDALAAFLGIFQHRLVSLFYRAWHKHHPPALRESAALQLHAPDSFTHSLFDFIGLGTEGLRSRLPAPDEALLLYAGLMAQRPLSASALRAILSDRFQVAVEVGQFIGKWSGLEPADRSYLSPESESNQLGVAAFLGDKVWDQQARINLRVGPLPLSRFRAFLPRAETMLEFTALVRFLVGPSLAFDVQPVLQANAVPELHLAGNTPDAPRLGWTTWLKTKPFTADASDAVFAYDA